MCAKHQKTHTHTELRIVYCRPPCVYTQNSPRIAMAAQGVCAYEKNIHRLLLQCMVQRVIYPRVVREEKEHASGACHAIGGRCKHLYAMPVKSTPMAMPMGMAQTPAEGSTAAASMVPSVWAVRNLARYTRVQHINEGRVTLSMGPLDELVWEDVETAMNMFAEAMGRINPLPPVATRRYLGQGLGMRIETTSVEGSNEYVTLLFLVPRLTDDGRVAGLVNAAHNAPPAIASKRGAHDMENGEEETTRMSMGHQTSSNLMRLVEHNDRERIHSCVTRLGALHVDSPDVVFGVGEGDADTYRFLFCGYSALTRSDLNRAKKIDDGVVLICITSAGGITTDYKGDTPPLIMSVDIKKNSAITTMAIASASA